MRVSAEISGGEALETYFARANEANAKIKTLEDYVFNLPVGAEYAIVRRLLRQDRPGGAVNTGLVMPDIRNLSLVDLTKLRKDYDGSFARLRHALKKYLSSIEQLDSEQKFRHVIEEIDYECRAAEDEFNGIRRKHSRSLKGMLVTSSLVGIAALSELVAPGSANIATAASAVIGSVTLHDVLSQRIKGSNDIDDLQKSDYWIAWKLHQENQRRLRR